MSNRGRHLGLVCLLFLLSGAAALAYQVIWQRVLGVFSGLHIYSITLIVTAFMAGLGFGSLVGGKFADRLTGKTAVLGFAICELAIGGFALISPWLYYDVAYLELGFLVRYPLVMPLVHFVLVVFPTFLMGASLPLLARGMVQGTAQAARTIGLLYGVNALGAGVGAFVTVWYLIGSHGFVTTIRLAALLNFLAAVGALWIWRGLPDGGAPADTAAEEAPEPVVESSRGLVFWASLYGLSGFIALSLEILWFRILDVTIKSSPYTFGHLLGLFLAFLGCGSIAGALLVSRSRTPDRVYFWGQWGITLSAAVALLALVYWPSGAWPVARLHEYWSSPFGTGLHEILEQLGVAGSGSSLVRLAFKMYFVVPFVLLGLPTFLMGLTYAYVQRAVQTDVHQVGWRVGVIQTSNIVGSIFGSLLTGGLFLTMLGTPLTMSLLILAGALYGCMAVVRQPGIPRTAGVVGVVAIAALLAAAVPGASSFWSRLHGSSTDQLIVKEDASSVVAMQQVTPTRAVLRVNGSGHSYLPYGGVHTLLGVVPTLIHPAPRNALVIGLGAGETAWGIGLSPDVERIDVYEIAVPEYDVIGRFFAGAGDAYLGGRRLLEDERVRVTFADGRLALRTGEARYDLIEADGLEPLMAYSGNLYSQEFFELVKSRLEPGGLMCTYSPTQRTRRTVVATFPYVLDFYLEGVASFMVGSLEPIDYDPQAMLARLVSPDARARQTASGASAVLVRNVLTFLQRVEVVSITPQNRDRIEATDLNHDLYPRDEYDRHPVWREPWPFGAAP